MELCPQYKPSCIVEIVTWLFKHVPLEVQNEALNKQLCVGSYSVQQYLCKYGNHVKLCRKCLSLLPHTFAKNVFVQQLQNFKPLLFKNVCRCSVWTNHTKWKGQLPYMLSCLTTRQLFSIILHSLLTVTVSPIPIKCKYKKCKLKAITVQRFHACLLQKMQGLWLDDASFLKRTWRNI